MSIVSGFFFSGTHCKGVSKQLCVYHLYRNVFLAQTFAFQISHCKGCFKTTLCLSSLVSKRVSETRFQTRFETRFETPFSSCRVYHRFLISRVRGMPGMLSLRSCIAQFHPKHNAFKRVSKQLRVYLLYRSVFLAQTRFRSPFFPRLRKVFLYPIIKTALRLSSAKGVSNPIIKTALRLSSAKSP